MALIVPLPLGVGDPTLTVKAAEIASTGRRGASVAGRVGAGCRRGQAQERHLVPRHSEDTLPPADRASSGRRVDFRSEFPDPTVVGANVYVAYAAGRPELGAA